MKKIIICFAFLINVAYADTGIYFETGNDLLPLCQAAIRSADNPNYYSPTDALMGTKCMGYIEGVVDTFEDTLQYSNVKAYNQLGADLYQVPTIQVCRVVVNYMNNYPQYLNYRASSIIGASLILNYNLPIKK